MLKHEHGERLYYIYDGRHLTLDRLLEIAHEKYGNKNLNRHTLDRRLRRGWRVEQALSIPVGSARPGERNKPHKHRKAVKTLTDEQQAEKQLRRRQQSRKYYRKNRDHIRYISYRSKFKVWLNKYATPEKLDELENLIKNELQQKEG